MLPLLKEHLGRPNLRKHQTEQTRLVQAFRNLVGCKPTVLAKLN